MADDRGVRFEREGPIGRIVLDRPEVGNVFDLPAARAFGAAVTAAESPDVAVVTVTGGGRLFCGGGDIDSFLAGDDPAAYIHALATELERHLRRLGELPKPVVSAVHGSVAGAGLAVVLNSDITVVSDRARFVFAYPGIGLTPDVGVSYLLPRAIGQQRALDFAVSGRVLTAADALDWGLVSAVVEPADLQPRLDAVTAQLAPGATAAFGEAKRLIRASWETSRADSANDESETLARLVMTEDAQRLIRTFLTRRVGASDPSSGRV